MLNEKSQLKKIAGEMNEDAYKDFEMAWKADLGVLLSFEKKQDVLDVANAYLDYYGASNRVIDCKYDYRNSTYMWEVRPKDQNLEGA